ncbi:MAG: enoyl-CoA hydratase/isomerase family protein [Acidimicrobiia bacterium]
MVAISGIETYPAPRCFRVEDRGGVTVVTIDRPPANALAPDLVADGLAVLDALRRGRPRAVVLMGAGRFFSGGADLRVVPRLSRDEQAEMGRGVNRLFAGWHCLPCPLVTAVNGHAVAGGLVLALCGDYRIGPTTGRFGLTEIKAGIPFPSMAMAVVQAELAPGVARRLILGAELVDAPTARELGVFDEIADDDSGVVARALDVARALAELPPSSYGVVKQHLRASTLAGAGAPGAAMREAVADEALAAARSILDRDAKER